MPGDNGLASAASVRVDLRCMAPYHEKTPSGPMPKIEIDEDLSRMEADIRQLKIQYEQFFSGGKKRPPKDVEWRLDLLVKRYGDRGAQMNYAQRFRYGNLTQTYAKYRSEEHTS